jgi:intron-binding protein aquarius
LERDVPARYLLRLGMGEQELATSLDFSRVGRVNAMLARRLELLAEVCPTSCVVFGIPMT